MNSNKLIIFDLDGTLYKLKGGSFSSSELNKEMLKNAAKYIQVKLNKSREEASEILKNIKIEYGENISIALEEKYNLDRYEYFDYVWDIDPKNLIIKYDNLENILMRMSKEYQFLLTSDAPRKWIENVLKELNIDSFFEGKILSGEGNKRKVFGNRFTYIAKEYNIKPEQIVAIGDQEESDIIPAKQLGFKTIYINKENKSDVADISIKDTKYLEAAFSFLFSDIMKNKYYNYAIEVLGIKEPHKAIVLSGSSDAIVFKYGNWIYKSSSTKESEEELVIYNNFKKKIGSDYELVFPYFEIVNSNEDMLLYKLDFIGEYNLEDYLLSPKLCDDTITQKIYGGVLRNISTIYNASYTKNKSVMDDFFVELIKAIEQNMKKAQLLNKKSINFLCKIKKNKEIFTNNATGSLAHKDLTAGNIIINLKNSNPVRFIDPRKALPYLDESFSMGNVSVDLAGYYVTILRKEMEHRELFGDSSLINAKILIEQEIEDYINKKIINRQLLDLVVFFWYSVYLACKCEYCTSKKRKWLYDEMKSGYDVYLKKIEEYI